MKILLFLIGIVAAGIVGYSFEPQMRFALTGKSEDYKPVAREAVKTVVVDAGPAKKSIDPTTWPVDKLPKKIELKGDAEIANEAGDIKMTITEGNRVDLVRVEGQNVVISPGPGPFEGTVPIINTDLLEQLTALAKILPPEEMVADPVDPPAVVTTGDEPATPDIPTEVAVVAPEVIENSGTPAVDPESPSVPEVAVNGTGEETSGEPASATGGGSADVVAVMQSSIKSGDIKEFTFDQVLEWTANAEAEEIDGKTFQTGIASYKAETVFGVKTIQAKALIQDGKVVRWLWPKSGMEIK